jgi:hypothetical protein
LTPSTPTQQVKPRSRCSTLRGECPVDERMAWA